MLAIVRALFDPAPQNFNFLIGKGRPILRHAFMGIGRDEAAKQFRSVGLPWIDDFGRVVGGVQGKIGLTSVRVRSVAGEAASSQNGTNLEAEIDPVFQGAQQGGQQEHRKLILTRILGRAEAHFFGVWVQGNHLLLTGREE